MVTPNELRKKLGCWSCEFCKKTTTPTDAIASCASSDPEIRDQFSGWESALTCKGYRMLPYTVAVRKEQKNGKR